MAWEIVKSGCHISGNELRVPDDFTGIFERVDAFLAAEKGEESDPPPPEPLVPTTASVLDLPLPMETTSVLLKNGIEQVRDLLGQTRSGLLSIRGIGPRRLKSIKRALATTGYRLATPVDREDQD